MSKIDLDALAKASIGNPRDKVMVTKGYLKAIYNELIDQQAKRRTAELSEAQARAVNKGMDETFGHMDKAFSAMDRMFDGVFGKGKSGRIFRRKS